MHTYNNTHIMHAYTHMHPCTYTYTIHIHTYTHAYKYMHACMHAHAYTHTLTDMYTYIPTALLSIQTQSKPPPGPWTYLWLVIQCVYAFVFWKMWWIKFCRWQQFFLFHDEFVEGDCSPSALYFSACHDAVLVGDMLDNKIMVSNFNFWIDSEIHCSL